MKRPSFKNLTKAQQHSFGNGIGPYWFPDWLRNIITENVSWFFEDASWRHHDFGYYIGFTKELRAEYDWKFFKAMLRDALSQNNKLASISVPIACFLSFIFYASVRLFGSRSFHYSTKYRQFKTTKKAGLNPRKSRVKGTTNMRKRRA